MLTFNIVTNEKSDTFYFADSVVEHMGYVGPQQKILLQRKQPKEIVKPGYFPHTSIFQQRKLQKN